MRTVLRTIAAVFVLWMGAAGAALGQDRPSLFAPEPQVTKRLAPAEHPPQARALLRARDVAPDLAVLERIADKLQRAPGTVQELQIPAFGDTSFVAELQRVERTANGVTNFYGTLRGVPYGTVVLTLSRGTLAGTLQANGIAYKVRFLGKGRYDVEEFDKQQFDEHEPDMPTPAPMSRPKADQVTPMALDDGSTIDVLVVYTPAARAAASPGDPSNPAAILAEIDNAIAATNGAYMNSGVTQRVNLVHAEEVTYTETGNLQTDLLHLSDVDATFHPLPLGSDGFLDSVPALRDTWGADEVSLWVDGPGFGTVGIGWLMDPVDSTFERFAYNVVMWNTASSNQTFAHELGHNMGLRHDSYMDGAATPFTYAHGYIDLAQRFRTIMAYNNQCTATPPNTSCTRIDYFSTPLQTLPSFGNAAAGDAVTADSTHALNQTNVTVANFRASIPQAGTIEMKFSTVNTNEGAGSVDITVSRIGGSLGAASVDYATSAGNAIPGTDYTDVSGTLNWADGDNADKLISVPILEDTAHDGTRTFTVTLSNATGGVAGTPLTANVVIADDEPSEFNFAQPAYTVIEGGAAVTMQVTRTIPFTNAASVTWTTADGTANAGQDFGTNGSTVQKTGTLSWAAGDGAAKSIVLGTTIPILNDTAFEPDETFTIALSSPTGGAVVGAQGTTTVTIRDNESHIELSSPTYAVDEAAGTVTLTLNRTESTALAQSVHWAAANGSALAGSDYGTSGVATAPSGIVTFAAGETTKTFAIAILNDAIIEGPETFSVALSLPTNGAVLGGNASATVTIASDDRGVSMQGSALTVAEGAGNAAVTVLRNGASTGAMSVNYATSNLTATAPANYTATSGTLSWADGDAAPKTILVPIVDDSVVNAARTFRVLLSAPVGATLGASATTVTIADDDNNLQLSAATASVAESTASVTLNVTRTGSAANAASVTWTALNGSAIAGSDFGVNGDPTAPTGTLNWAAGDAAMKAIVIPILPDALIEGSETFTVALSGPSGTGTSLGATTTATVTITDDDKGVTFAQPAYTVIEGGPAVMMQVQRIGSAVGAISVTWTTSDGTAAAGQDFGTNGSPTQRTGTLSWASGDAAPKTITLGSTIPILNDTAFESDETFTVTLSAPTGGAGLGPQPSTTVTIVDNESTFDFTSATASATEGAGPVVLTVTRTGSTALTQMVSWRATNGSALAGSDYGSAGITTAPAGTLAFAAGETSKTISIPILNDALIEGPETFTVALASPTMGGTLGATSTSTVTIASDDKGLTMGAATASVAENAGSLSLQVVRSGPPTGAASVSYSFVNGTAMNGTHYAGTPGTLNWADGDASAKTIPVTINDDFAVNAGRTFTVRLAGATGATLGTPMQTMVTIADDDNTLQFNAATATVTEGVAAVMLTVTRVGGTANPASVTWTTADGTALAGTDFGTLGDTTQPTATLSWAAGVGGAKTFTIPILNDSIVEGAKTFTVTLSAPSGATLGTIPTTTITLNDNDAGVAFSAATYSIAENGGNAVLTVNRIGPATTAASVHWATSDGSASAGQDFGTLGSATQRSGMVSWLAGDAAPKNIVIPILNDATAESDETFTVTLSAPSTGIVLGTPNAATVTILDDDVPAESQFSFTQPKYLVLENAGNATIGVSRDALSGGGFTRAASVKYSTVAGSALVGSDYTTRTGTLSWAIGESGVKTFTVPITNDTIGEANETFKVTLSAPLPGATIATPEATVLIVDDDEVFPPQGAIPSSWTIPVAATAGWHVSNDPGAFQGVYSLRTDQVGDGETAQIQVAGTFVAGTASFYAKVSSEPGFDVLRFYVDGVKRGEWSGTTVVGWQFFTTPITAGVHTLMWSYEKDGSASVGQDAAWLDSVALPSFTP